jgi:hypothetical protein
VSSLTLETDHRASVQDGDMGTQYAREGIEFVTPMAHSSGESS